jgi:hypothetical protein
MNRENFIKKATIAHNDRYDYSLVENNNIKNKFIIICSIHGAFLQRGDAHLSGQGCPDCGGSLKKTKMMFIYDANKIHGDKYKYSEAKYVNTKTLTMITCPIHGTFQQTPDNHLSGHGCPNCAFNKNATDMKELSANNFIKKAEKVHGSKYDYSNVVYVNAKVKIKIMCDLHGVFEQSPNDHLCGKGCLSCSLKETKPEIEIKDFLMLNNVDFIENDRSVLDGKEIDILLPKHDIGIEYDGLYWHSDIFKDRKYHINKTNNSEKKNIQLIHIFEDEWLENKNIVKSIIKSKLGLYDNRYYGRKCIVKEIDSKTSKTFLIENHLQGNVNSGVKIGLFYDNKLVSLMTFGKKRISLGSKTSKIGEYELLRFCNKLNTQIIGGASKLFKYFLRNYSPTQIISFADRRYSHGDLYTQLGFEHVYNTQPNYFYFNKNNGVREHRYKYRKNVLVSLGHDKSKTEFEIMKSLGYLKIYDSGSMKFNMTITR